MTKNAKKRGNLDKKFQKVLKTPAGFDFFVAIHDFIEYIEANSFFIENLSSRIKSNRDLKIPTKYNFLKQIYQGLEDIHIQTNADLGHERYMTLGDLKKIRNNNFSESNSFWRKRELFRKMTSEIYERLNLKSVEV
ncbi:MAG: hypothetical protein A2174_01090 [Candidatus Portnoybacteria bacterium RBG_13_41_18]|uniref:Uncharacterized protein n=1 Tax=Candidatus Portnoybacteria bacterium RBG_13_41_18 TaxID=1801991 RepID=A0A1G2F5R7_9BACT|nr:MAG: hypothetical protein A2174_01090 [Candidatus Portnoybacteria bacterium RBG_13_41_18]